MRPLATSALALLVLGSGGLVYLAKHQDRANPTFNAQLRKHDEVETRLLKAEFRPQEVGATLAVARSSVPPPPAFTATCALCHEVMPKVTTSDRTRLAATQRSG